MILALFSSFVISGTYKGAVLALIDGFGESAWPSGNGIESASMPFLDFAKRIFPYQSIVAAQQAVGLTRGEPGSSAVGHQTIGLGRTAPSYYQIMEKSMNKDSEESMVNNKVLRDGIRSSKNKRVHYVGLCTEEGIFSHIKFLPAMFEAALLEDVDELYVHCILTTLTHEPAFYIETVESMLKIFPKEKLDKMKVRVAGIYSGETAMDKVRNWSLTKKAFEAMIDDTKATHMKREKAYKYLDTLNRVFPIFDPICIEDYEGSCKDSIIKDGDAVVLFHYREDKTYQIAKAFIDGIPEQDNVKSSKRPHIKFIPLILYDVSFYNRDDIQPIIPAIKYENSLASWISQKGFSQLRVAEEYKRGHATIFFSGGILQPIFPGEDRCVDFDSKAESIVDKFPLMNASKITDAVIKGIQSNKYKLIFVNFANVDATGHTGNLTAVKIASEYVDKKLKEIYEECEKNNYLLFITSDHGNGEELLELNGEKQVYHTLNNVPFIVLSNDFENYQLKTGKAPFLGNVAPSILYSLDIDIPPEMEQPIIRKKTLKNIKIEENINSHQNGSSLSFLKFHDMIFLIGFVLGCIAMVLLRLLFRFMNSQLITKPFRKSSGILL